MAREEQLEDRDPRTGYVILSAEDAAYIASQLTLSVQRAREGQRLGTHLMKRMRRSKAILLTALESTVYRDPREAPKKKGFWQRLFGKRQSVDLKNGIDY